MLRDIRDVIDNHVGRSRTVLEYGLVTKRLVDEAKRPGFCVDSWAPLAELVASDEFERVGAFKEVMDWPSYLPTSTNWATSSGMGNARCSNITETLGAVFLELQERSRIGEFANVVNSLSVYEFTNASKIRHIDLYLQMELPPAEMLKSFEEVEDLGIADRDFTEASVKRPSAMNLRSVKLPRCRVRDCASYALDDGVFTDEPPWVGLSVLRR